MSSSEIKFRLNEAINSARKFTAHLYHNVNIENKIGDEVEVFGSQTNIVQVLIILLTNAARAIEKAEKKIRMAK